MVQRCGNAGDGLRGGKVLCRADRFTYSDKTRGSRLGKPAYTIDFIKGELYYIMRRSVLENLHRDLMAIKRKERRLAMKDDYKECSICGWTGYTNKMICPQCGAALNWV